MCGIVGAVTNLNNGFRADEVDSFLEALYYDAMRGMDSTGVFSVNTTGNVIVHKEATQAGVFLKADEIKEFRSDAIKHGKFLVGHNRAATRGVIKDENAHPFIIDDKIVLVQNGTWKGDHKHVKDTEVDTEALAHIIHEAGDDVVEVFKKINAAFALTWYNVSTKTIHLARNSERPLFLATLKNGSKFWCSEPGFIRLAIIRNRLEVDKMEEVPENTLISFKLEDNKSFKELERQTLPRFQHPIVVSKTQMDYGEWPYAGNMAEAFPLARPMPPRHHQRPAVKHDPARADIDFLTGFHLCPDSKDYYVEHIDAGRMQQKMMAVMQSKQPVELHDYIAANDSSHCSTFFVWGTIIIPDDNDILQKFVVYWLLHDTSEMEVLNYISNNIYSVKITTSRTNRTSPEDAVVVGLASDVSVITEVTDVLQ